ncbi:nucleotide disphospho-sugar-binding domain-containing protein [Micromonospora auratinigra]|uniref:UDP:flavonoid glycosyltransferase YjiC, YdhE family n=1 Tax=Micromonospora auratinigra TaxID=261654 RepID=A0A1A8ZFD6_9ACTN|nr:nucleotide disphospho-sugar-binding domain-containing protein [Micromonospora auratinigra]SBT42720.1 UDP:flavonoid glycosyltransferase YjiC, YdhE family [Micromonospora auratinigra]
MRVLFTTSNWAGHWYCMVPLGWALQAAGHEVRVTCAPAQATAVGRAGLTPVPVTADADMMVVGRMTHFVAAVLGTRTLPGLPRHPLTGAALTDLAEFDFAADPGFWDRHADGLRRGFDAVAGFAAQWRPDLVCHDVMAPEGAVVAARLGVPSVFVAPGLFGTVEVEPGLDLRAADEAYRVMAPDVDWSRAAITHVVDPSPSSALPPVGDARRLPVRYVPYNGPGALPEWALHRPDRGRICVIWGHSATGIFGPDVPALRHAVEAAADTGAEVVLTASAEQVDALGTLPAGVRPLRGFPLHLLLPGCDAVLHHGSDNVMMNAAVAGVPQVALPLDHDQLAYGRRIVPTGAAVSVPGLAATADEVRAALHAVRTDPRYAAAARELRAEQLRRPTPTEVAAELTALAGHSDARDLVAGTAG